MRQLALVCIIWRRWRMRTGQTAAMIEHNMYMYSACGIVCRLLNTEAASIHLVRCIFSSSLDAPTGRQHHTYMCINTWTCMLAAAAAHLNVLIVGFLDFCTRAEPAECTFAALQHGRHLQTTHELHYKAAAHCTRVVAKPLSFSKIRTEERMLKQACLLLMYRACNLGLAKTPPTLPKSLLPCQSS